jgi:hypothetical protein
MTLPLESRTRTLDPTWCTAGTALTGIQVSNVSSRRSRAGSPPLLIQDLDARFRGKPEVGDLDLTRRGEVGHLDEEALGSIRHLEERTVHHYPHVAPALLPICCQAGQPDNYRGGIHGDKVYHSPLQRRREQWAVRGHPAASQLAWRDATLGRPTAAPCNRVRL